MAAQWVWREWWLCIHILPLCGDRVAGLHEGWGCWGVAAPPMQEASKRRNGNCCCQIAHKFSPIRDREDVCFLWSSSLSVQMWNEMLWSVLGYCRSLFFFFVASSLKGGLSSFSPYRVPRHGSRVSFAFVISFSAIQCVLELCSFILWNMGWCLLFPFCCSRSSRGDGLGVFRAEVYSYLICSLREIVYVIQKCRELFCYYFIKSAFFGKGDP